MFVYVAMVIEMFCAYLKIDMDIDVVICCVKLVAIVFKFNTCELFDMDNGMDYDLYSSNCSYLLRQYIVSKNAQKDQIHS